MPGAWSFKREAAGGRSAIAPSAGFRMNASPSPLTRLFLSCRRVTTSGQYIAQVDGLRFAAILSVFIYHLVGDVLRHSPPGYRDTLQDSFLFRLSQQLQVGVPLFFAISGQILAWPFALHHLKGSKPVRLKAYFLRRLTRLEPPYMLSLLIFFVLKIIGGRGEAGDLWPHLGASLLYLHNTIYLEPSVINIVAWSLEVEVQFYILMPLLALVFTIRSAAFRRTLLAGTIAALTLWSTQNQFVHLSVLGNLHYFLIGFLLADLRISYPPDCHGHRFWDAVSLAGWPLMALVFGTNPLAIPWTLPAGILVLYLAAFYGPGSRRFWGAVWISSIGGMCYTIYLIHNYLIALIGFGTERWTASLPFEGRVLARPERQSADRATARERPPLANRW